MDSRHAILVNGSRLVRELIKRVIEKNAVFEVVKELSDLQELPEVAKSTNANWIFVVLLPGQKVPDDLKIELLLRLPSVRIIGLYVDDGYVHAEWMVHQERDFTGMKLEDFVNFLVHELDISQTEAVKSEKN